MRFPWSDEGLFQWYSRNVIQVAPPSVDAWMYPSDDPLG